MDKVSKKWQLKKQVLSSEALSVLDKALDELNKRCDVEYSALKYSRNRYSVCYVEPYVFVLVAGSCIPLIYEIVAIDTVATFYLLPSKFSEHFQKVCNGVELRNEEEVVILHRFINCDIGLLEKGCLPIKINGIEDLQRHEIVSEVAVAALEDGKSIWWQKWGGAILSFDIDMKATCPLREYKLIDHWVGKHQVQIRR